MLMFDGKTAEAGDHLKQAANSWNAAERAARAASVTLSSSRPAIAETPRTVPAPVATTQQPPIQTPPPVAQQLPAPPPPNPSVEIASVVANYARAIESRDLSAVRRAYPGITSAQSKGWEQFFPTLRSLRVTISINDLEVNGSSADAKLVGAYDYVTSSGKNEHQPVAFQASFRRDATGWSLISVH
jgi:hypothetical protein